MIDAESLGYCRFCHCSGTHIPGCPSEEQHKEIIGICIECDSPIFEGEDYYRLNETDKAHRECFEDEHLVTA